LFILLISACTPSAPTQPPSAPTPPVFGEPQIPETEVPRVKLEDAKAAFDGGTAVFVDVRSPESYKSSHVPGALSIPVYEMEARAAELDPQQWIITYCT
jgi:3-mercaptopyruvate sulfurtransferase SseA